MLEVDCEPESPYTFVMAASLTVLWPEYPAPDMMETRFSYDFCRKMSRRFCKTACPPCTWIDYSPEGTIQDVLTRITGDIILLLTNPETVISPSAIHAFARCLDKGYKVCGPVYQQTEFSRQAVALDTPYVDMDTFLEMAGVLAEQNHAQCVPADRLDPSCIACRVADLKRLSESTPVIKIPISLSQLMPKRMAVVPGALVHRGFSNDFQREDLIRLVPEGVKRVLDMGCAMGGYGKALKAARPEIHLTGVELNPALAETAEPYYDAIIARPVEEAELQGPFDLINCGDILEHLEDPWAMLRRINGLLREEGYLALSIPNAGHWSVVRALLNGTFQYVPAGLLAIDHLRWFTQSTVRTALTEAGFSIETFLREQPTPTPAGKDFIKGMQAAGYGDEASLTTFKFLIRAVSTHKWLT
ncbi:MAG: class I SAM-dependent methyltransferase [Deltaproteobacteria bacterium]|nr:class I SAM-dependent methyltransferase [Deltaproteobacteria bacterium]